MQPCPQSCRRRTGSACIPRTAGYAQGSLLAGWGHHPGAEGQSDPVTWEGKAIRLWHQTWHRCNVTETLLPEASITGASPRSGQELPGSRATSAPHSFSGPPIPYTCVTFQQMDVWELTKDYLLSSTLQ